jgi:antirestriction protein ArdC
VKDIHATITERFIAQLRAGCVPWQRPWQSVQNLVSKKAYKGINSLTLGSTRFGSPFWMTFRQAHELGGTVRKRERSSPVIYYKFLEKRDENGSPVFTAKGKPAYIPFIRWSNVFNVEQTEGVTAPAVVIGPESPPALEQAEALVRQADLCPIRQEGFAAVYSPRDDIIRMPSPRMFRSSEDYYHTLFHEMTHATGHASRLDREGITNPIKFGSERYSKEELIAELGAAFLANKAGILDQVRFDNSAAYLNSWIKKLEDDPALIVSAASHAQRGFDWVTGRRHEEQESFQEEFQAAQVPVPALRQEFHLPAPSRTAARLHR